MLLDSWFAQGSALPIWISVAEIIIVPCSLPELRIEYCQEKSASFPWVLIPLPFSPFLVLSHHGAMGLEGREEWKAVWLWTTDGQKTLTGDKCPALNGLYFIAAVLLLSWGMRVDFSRHTAACVQRLQVLGFGWAASVAWLTGALGESCRVRPGTTRPVLVWYDTNSRHRPKPVWLWHPTSAGRQRKACEEAWEKKELALPALLRKALMCH